MRRPSLQLHLHEGGGGRVDRRQAYLDVSEGTQRKSRWFGGSRGTGTEQTVRFHLTNIYRKLGVVDRTATARLAVDRGLVETVPGSVQRAVNGFSGEPRAG